MNEPILAPQSPPQTRKRSYAKHGTTALRKALKGARTIDKRTRVGKALAAWRADLIRDLGGAPALSTQQLALVELAVRTKLILDSIDTWLLSQPTLINKRSRSVLPVVRERTQLADSLARTLNQLGLARVAADEPTSLASYLKAKAKQANGGSSK